MLAGLIGLVILPDDGHAQTVVPPSSGPCIVAGVVVTCTGDLSAGVDADGPTITTLNINNLTQNIGNTGATSSIDFDTTNADATAVIDLGAFQATNSASVTAVIDVGVLGTGNVDINSTGNLIHNGLGGGIIGSVTGDGNVLILSQGNIAAQGAGINGFVTNNGNVTVQSIGDITIIDPTTGLPAFFTTPTGIIAGITNNGDININSTGNISVSGGGLASGIRANNFVGFAVTNVTIVSNGDINVSGALINSFGINGGTETGNMTITSIGNISANTGILSLIGTVGDSTIFSTGNIAALDFGIDVDTPSGRADVTVDGGNVSGADGISIDVNSATASTVNVLAGGTVQGTGTDATNRAVEITGSPTNITVAGNVIGNSGNAIQFAPGAFQDRLELLPGFAITGIVFADAETDTLRFSGPGSDTFDLSLIDTGSNTQQYREFEIFEVNDGTWTFSNATTAAFIANGGTTRGNATFGGLTINSGATLEPGNGLGTMTVLGGVVFNDGSIFNVDIQPDGTSDLLSVRGTTTISSSGTALNATLNPLTTPTEETIWTVITADGGVSGQFGSVSDNLPDIDLEAIYNPNSVQLRFVPASDDTSAKEIHPSATMAALESSLLYVETLRRRSALHNARRMSDGQSCPKDLTQWPEKGMSAIYPNGLDKSPCHGSETAIWGAVMGGHTDVDSVGSIAGWNTTIGGLALGVDRQTWTSAGAPAVYGASIGYSYTDVQSGLSQAHIDSFHVGLYGATNFGRLSLSGSAAYSYHDFDFDRVISATGTGTFTANGKADGDGVSASVEAFYDVSDTSQGDLRYGPLGTIDLVHVERSAFAETGAGILNLSVNSDSASQAILGLGAAIGIDRVIANKPVSLDASIQWQHLAGDDDVTTRSTLSATSTTFDTASAPIDRNRLAINFGAAIAFSDDLSGHIRYNGAFGANAQSHKASIGLSRKF